jgi:rfaE bifunctional protein kinase chain/domain
LTTERTVLQERLLTIVRRFPERKVLIVGDAIADRFLHGTISRVSREAPVFILKHDHTETVPGGAANCAMNLASFGAAVSLISITGKDEAGLALRVKLEGSGVDCNGLLVSEKVSTTTKVRILAGQSHSSRQQVIRIDYEGEPLADRELRAALAGQIRQTISEADAVIISDYNYGVANDDIVELLRELVRANAIPILVDSRFRLSHFPGFTSATPNEDEVEQLIGERIVSQSQLESVAEHLRQQLGYRALLVTRGGQGMMLLEDEVTPLHIKAVGAQEPVDVTGAGDTVIATFALALASNASFQDATRLANYAGGLVVMKRGTASITAHELESSILNSESK